MASDLHLNGHHRDTLAKIFTHPTSDNIQWREVLSLLDAVGTVSEEHSGKFKVSLGAATEFLEPPRGKDIDRKLVSELRRLLRQAGIEPGSALG